MTGAAPIKAAILGCAGLELSPGERWFFETARPWGFILFRRNCETREQVARLIRGLRAAVGRPDAPVLVDQEGGRVARLGPPEWPAYAPAGRFAALYASDPERAREALGLQIRLMAHDLREVGFSVNCLPVADVPAPDAHDIIGDRAYGADPAVIADLAGLAARTLTAEGVLPVLKHVPGHGRARADSHESLPRVEAALSDLDATDFAPFRALTDIPLAMTAHVVYEAIDTHAPATLSSKVVGDIIRQRIGYDGLLMTDDLSMGALKGPFDERARRSIEAGCDMILHCNGDMSEMAEVIAGTPDLQGEALRRAEAALTKIACPALQPFEPHSAWAKLEALLDSVA